MAKHIARKTDKQKALELSEKFEGAFADMAIQWANCDTWLSNVVSLLFRIDLNRAHLIYASFTSSRARAELVDRAAIMCLKRPRDVKHLRRLLREFKAVTRTRNKFCHAQYSLSHGKTVLASYLHWNYSSESFDGVNAFEHRRIDGNVLNEIVQAKRKAFSLCNSFERFVKTKPKLVLKLPRKLAFAASEYS